MAAIDARIPLGVQPVQLPNPLAQMSKLAEIQGLQQRNRLYDLQTQEIEREAAAKRALNDAWQANIGPDGSINRQGLISGLAQAGQGAQIPALQKQFSDMDASQRQALKSQFELARERLALGAQLLGGVKDQASYDQARAIAQANGIDVSEFPTQFSPEIVQQAMQRALTAQQRLELHWKELGFELEKQKFGEQQRHNRATEGISAANLALQRERETRQMTQPVGAPIEVLQNGIPILVQRYADGSLRPVEGYSPRPRDGMVIETGPDGSTRISTGGAATSGQKLTEQQSKDLVYLTRGESAIETLDSLDKTLSDPVQRAAGSIPGLGNALVTEAYQKAEQAGREFLAAVLRKDTGAAITSQEMEQYGKIYLPQPFDSPETLAQKARARRVALDAIRSGLGPAAALAPPRSAPASNRNPSPGSGASAPASGMGVPSDIADLLNKYGGGSGR